MSYTIGAMIPCKKDTDLLFKFQQAKELGLTSCQISIWDPSFFQNDEFLIYVKDALQKADFTISALWAGWSGPCEWNFHTGPDVVGLVPPAYRFQRLKELMTASDFAEKLGISKIITHVGFLPETPSDPNFIGTVGALRSLAKYMRAKGQYFLFETGQETPTTLLRTIESIGCDNLGINLDTGNLILYGKGNPLDALDVFGKYVMETHIKDGFYPTDGMHLGQEAPAGAGKANISAVIRRLQEIGYDGAFTIEREISGEKQIEDILTAKRIIEESLA